MRAKGLLAAGRVDFHAGRWPRGVELCAQSRDLYREVGEPAGEARALIWMAFNRWGTEDDDEIGEILAAAIEAARRAERPLETGIALGLTGTWWCLRDVDRAQELVEEGGRLLEHAGNPNWLAHSYEFRALVAYLRGDHRRARDLLASALPLYLQIGNRVCSAHCLETTAALAAATGRPDGAAQLLGAAERMREVLGTAAPPYERIVRERGVGDVKAALDATRQPRRGSAAARSASRLRWRGPARWRSADGAQEAQRERGAQQARRALVHGHDLGEGGGRRRVVLGDRVEAAHVAVDRPHRQGTRRAHLGQREVGAGGQPPGVVGRGPGGREEASRQSAVAVANAVAQRDGVGGGDGHALSVERVEGGRSASPITSSPAGRARAGRSASGGSPGSRGWRSRRAARHRAPPKRRRAGRRSARKSRKPVSSACGRWAAP